MSTWLQSQTERNTECWQHASASYLSFWLADVVKVPEQGSWTVSVGVYMPVHVSVRTCTCMYIFTICYSNFSSDKFLNQPSLIAIPTSNGSLFLDSQYMGIVTKYHKGLGSVHVSVPSFGRRLFAAGSCLNHLCISLYQPPSGCFTKHRENRDFWLSVCLVKS